MSETAYKAARRSFDQYAGMDAPLLPADPLSALQVELSRWETGQFGFQPREKPALGMSEELGEMFEALSHVFGFGKAIGRVSHIVLKTSQGIRGFDDPEYARQQVADAIADVFIFGINLCTHFRIDAGTLLFTTSQEVLARNWKLGKK